MEAKLKLFVQSRKYLRKRVTDLHKKKDTFYDLPISEKDQIKQEIDDAFESLKAYNSEIQSLKWEEGQDEAWLNDELSTCEQYFKKIRECRTMLKENATPSGAGQDHARSLLKSPTAPLPEFKSLEGEDLLKFFKDFEGVTSMFKYSEYDKFILLKQQISGRALILLDSLESDKQGYTHAKDLLTSALASKDMQTFNVISQLSQLKMNNETDPFEYVSKMRNITETVKRLQLDSDSFLRYFFGEGMNGLFKMHLTQITNSVKPSLEEINKNFFEAAERYQNHRNLKNRSLANSDKSKVSHTDKAKVSVHRSASSFAAGVDYSKKNTFKPCSLCTNEDKEALHPIFKCDKFDSPQSKVDKIVSLNGCVKCSNLNHVAEKCQFRFNTKCKHCKGWHFSFLCVPKK